MKAKWAGPDAKGCHATYREHMAAAARAQYAEGRAFKRPGETKADPPSPPPNDSEPPKSDSPAPTEPPPADDGPPKERRRPWRRTR